MTDIGNKYHGKSSENQTKAKRIITAVCVWQIAVLHKNQKGKFKMVIKRGDVFYADLEPTIGSEQGGVRPVLVVQNNVGNKYSPTVVVLPISSAKKLKLPTHICIYGTKMLSKDSVILAEQIRTIDRNRLQEYVGSVDLEIMKKVETAMKISIGVDRND